MAKKSQEPLVISKQSQGCPQRAGCNTSGDAFMALNGYLYWLLEQAAKRGRRTAARPCARTTSWLDPTTPEWTSRQPHRAAGLKVLAAPRSVGAAPQSGPRGRGPTAARRAATSASHARNTLVLRPESSAQRRLLVALASGGAGFDKSRCAEPPPHVNARM